MTDVAGRPTQLHSLTGCCLVLRCGCAVAALALVGGVDLARERDGEEGKGDGGRSVLGRRSNFLPFFIESALSPTTSM